jgi:glycosyltransferase involved in cell wall biosynthesis
MRILIVSPWLPHPAIRHAGGQHLWHTVRSLAARGHRLHMLCYGRGEPETQVQPLAAMCDSLTILTPAYTWGQKLERVRRGGWRYPWRLGRQTHIAARAHIRELCAQVDVVHFAWTEMGCYLDAVPRGVGTVLGTLDVEYVVRPRELVLYPPGWARVQAARRARRLIRGERQHVRRAHVTLACSAFDRDHLVRLAPGAAIHVVPPWIDADAVRDLQSDSVVPRRLVFMGALDRFANVAAARWLVEHVWPRVRDHEPATTLRIVGANPPGSLRRLPGGDPRLTVTGFVPDLAAEWAAADVAVSPSLIGGGLVTKVAQPMAAGRPVVTTHFGNEGVAAPEGIAVEVADDVPAFAAAVLRLLRDREHWACIAAAGRQHVLDTLDWNHSMVQLEAAYALAAQQAKELP